MAQQDFTGGDGGAVFTLGLKVDPGASAADAQKAGKALADALAKAFGTLDLSKAVGTEGLADKFAAHGEEAAEGFAKGFKGKGEEAGKFGEGLNKGFETATRSAGALNVALEGVSRTLSSGSMATGVKALGEVGESLGAIATGIGGKAGGIGLAVIAISELAKAVGGAAEKAAEMVPQAAEATLSIAGMAKAAEVSFPQMEEFRKALAGMGIDADEMSKAMVRVQIRLQAAAGEIARSVRDSSLETADAQQRIVDAGRNIEAAQDNAASSAEKAGQAEARAAVTAATAWEEAAEKRRSINLSVEGAELGEAGAGLSLERARMQLRAFLGERISPQEKYNVRLRELQLAVSQAQYGGETAEERTREARTRRRQAQMYGAMGYGPGGELGPQAEIEKSFRDANAARRDEAAALDKVTEAERERIKALNALGDLQLKQIPAIAEILKAGKGDLSQVSPEDLQRGLFLRIQQLGGGLPGQAGALGELSRFGVATREAGLGALYGQGFAYTPTGQRLLGAMAVPEQREKIEQVLREPATQQAIADANKELAKANEVNTAATQAIEAGATALRKGGLEFSDEFVRGAHMFRDNAEHWAEEMVKGAKGAEAVVEAFHKGAADILNASSDPAEALREAGAAIRAVTKALTGEQHPGDEGHGYGPAPVRQNLEQPRQLGGLIFGAGGPTDDQVPIMASAGEYVIRAKAVEKLGVPLLDRLNRGEGMQEGGIIHFDIRGIPHGPGVEVEEGPASKGGLGLIRSYKIPDWGIPEMSPGEHKLFTFGWGVPPHQKPPPGSSQDQIDAALEEAARADGVSPQQMASKAHASYSGRGGAGGSGGGGRDALLEKYKRDFPFDRPKDFTGSSEFKGFLEGPHGAEAKGWSKERREQALDHDWQMQRLYAWNSGDYGDPARGSAGGAGAGGGGGAPSKAAIDKFNRQFPFGRPPDFKGSSEFQAFVKGHPETKRWSKAERELKLDEDWQMQRLMAWNAIGAGGGAGGGLGAVLGHEGPERFHAKEIQAAGWPKGWFPQTNTSDWTPNTGFALGGLIGAASPGMNPFMGMANGGMIPRMPGGDGATVGQHSLNLQTSGGEFQMTASADTIEAIRSSSIGAKLTSTGARPSWYS